MTDIRKQIIEVLDSPSESSNLYDTLKDCILFKYKDIDISLYQESGFPDNRTIGFDNWFKGVIRSLYYEPNKNLLVLEGKDEIELSKFLDKLIDDTCLPMISLRLRNTKVSENCLYHGMILDIDFEYKKTQDIIEQDNFYVYPHVKDLIDPGTDKRLCSYCSTTTHWNYPQRKNVTVLKVESIDWEKYNAIPKLELWIEVFNLFKPLNAGYAKQML